MKLKKLLLPLLFLLPALLSAPGRVAANVPLNRIIAIVNDDVVLQSELAKRENMILEQLRQQKAKLPPPDVLRRQVLERLILENLQLQMAERAGIRVDEETLNAGLRRLAQQNGTTLTEFQSMLEADGMNYQAFREEFRRQIIRSRLRQQMVDNRIQVTEQEIDNLLETAAAASDTEREYHLLHILVSLPESASPEQIQAAQARAQNILARLRGGADFRQTAIAESDSQDALEGGDLGWRKAGQLPSFFTQVIGELQRGQFSELIRTPSGFHIVKLEGVRGEDKHLVEQTRASHILLRPDALHDEHEIRTRINQLRARILAGDSFEELARAHSQDPGSASEGGDLGWVNPGQMVPEFEQAMNALEPGEISEPVKSRFGWHLIKVTGRRQHDDTQQFRRARARETIRKRKAEEELDIWLRRLRDEAYVEFIDDKP